MAAAGGAGKIMERQAISVAWFLVNEQVIASGAAHDIIISNIMFFYLVIIVVSLILNWGVQLSYYLWRIRKNPEAFAGQKTLLHYYTGYIGDGIIAPLINILIFYVIVRLGQKEGLEGLGGIEELIKRQPMGAIFVLTLVLDVITHYYQGKTKMINWSMPKPFQWNFAGKWHMISFSIQISYLLLFLWLLVHNGTRILSNWSMLAATVGIFALMASFLILYHFDNRTSQTTSKSLR